MTKVTINNYCGHGSGGGGGGSDWVPLVALVGVAVVVGPLVGAAIAALVGMVTAIVTGLVVSVGIGAAAWVVKNVAVAAIDAHATRQHNLAMARIYPDVARQLGLPGPPPQALPPGERFRAEVIDAKVIRRGEGS